MQVLRLSIFVRYWRPWCFKSCLASMLPISASRHFLFVAEPLTTKVALLRSFSCVHCPKNYQTKTAAAPRFEWPKTSYRDGPDVYEENADRQFLVWDKESIDRLRDMLGTPASFFERSASTRLAVE